MKWIIDETEPMMTEIGIEITHDDCFFTEFARQTNQEVHARVPTDPVENGVIHIYCVMPQALDKSEINQLFKKFNGNLVDARIYSRPRKPTFFDLRFRDKPISALFSTPNSIVSGYVATSEKEKVSIQFSPEVKLSDVTTKIKSMASVELSHVRRIPPQDFSEGLLTNHEVSTLQSLVSWGFYDLPRRGITLEQAASRMGTADSTLSLHVRNITDKVAREYLRRAMLFRE